MRCTYFYLKQNALYFLSFHGQTDCHILEYVLLEVLKSNPLTDGQLEAIFVSQEFLPKSISDPNL